MAKSWLAQHATFREAFPSVVSIDVQYWITGYGTEDRDFPLSAGSNDPVIGCISPRCKNGGANLAPLIAKMVKDNVAEQTHDVRCCGREGSVQRKTDSPCYNRFKIQIKLVLRPLPDTEKPQSVS